MSNTSLFFWHICTSLFFFPPLPVCKFTFNLCYRLASVNQRSELHQFGLFFLCAAAAVAALPLQLKTLRKTNSTLLFSYFKSLIHFRDDITYSITLSWWRNTSKRGKLGSGLSHFQQIWWKMLSHHGTDRKTRCDETKFKLEKITPDTCDSVPGLPWLLFLLDCYPWDGCEWSEPSENIKQELYVEEGERGKRDEISSGELDL